MDSLGLAPIAYDNQAVHDLINHGYSGWAVFFMIVQIILIPLIMFLVKQYEKKHIAEDEIKLANQKSLIDAERHITKLERDGQIADLNNRIDSLHKDSTHKIDEINAILEYHKKNTDTLFAKIDLLNNKIDTIIMNQNNRKG